MTTLSSTSGYPWPSDIVKSPGFFKPRERHTKAQSNFFFFFFNLLFLKSPPWNLLLADLITATLFLLKFSFSPGVHAVHRSQFQATSALWSKVSNLHYSLMRLPLPPLPPFPRQTQTTLLRRAPSQPWGVPGQAQLAFYDGPSPAPPTAGLVGGVQECRAGPGRPSVTDPSSVTDGCSEFIYMMWGLFLI